MRPVFKSLGFFGAGAGTMFFLDPRLGPRRRAILRDKSLHYAKVGAQNTSCFVKDVLNHARGWLIEANARIKDRPVADDVLIRRVRSKIGRAVSHPHALTVDVQQRTVILKGPVLKSEVPGLIRTVILVRGVREVHNQLEAHETGDHIPALQGVGRRR